MILKLKLFELEVDALQGRKQGLRVKCKNPACPRRCTLTFETPKGFSSVSEGMIAAAVSSLCRGLAKENASPANVHIQKSLM